MKFYSNYYDCIKTSSIIRKNIAYIMQIPKIKIKNYIIKHLKCISNTKAKDVS
jgi:hypothetical protein